MQIFERPHYIGKRCVWPPCPLDGLNFVRRYKAHHIAILQNQEASFSRLEEFLVDEVLNVQIAVRDGQSRVIMSAAVTPSSACLSPACT